METEEDYEFVLLGLCIRGERQEQEINFRTCGCLVMHTRKAARTRNKKFLPWTLAAGSHERRNKILNV